MTKGRLRYRRTAKSHGRAIPPIPDVATAARRAQPRRGCPVCVSCRWPASRGCAAVCPRHSPPCTRRLDVAVCTRQLCSKPLHGIRRSAQCAPRRPSGGIGASPGRSLLPAYAFVACNAMHLRRMCVRWAQSRVGAWAAPLRFYPSAVAVVSTRWH